MSNNPKSSDNLNGWLVALMIIGGVIAIYVWVFSIPDQETVMDKSGYFQERDNSGILPFIKIALIVLPIVIVYYWIKQYKADKKNKPKN